MGKNKKKNINETRNNFSYPKGIPASGALYGTYIRTETQKCYCTNVCSSVLHPLRSLYYSRELCYGYVCIFGTTTHNQYCLGTIFYGNKIGSPPNGTLPILTTPIHNNYDVEEYKQSSRTRRREDTASGCTRRGWKPYRHGYGRTGGQQTTEFQRKGTKRRWNFWKSCLSEYGSLST